MAKIHITLVGAHTYPVYLGIVETSPDEVLLVHSANSLAEAQRIAAEFEGSGIPFSFEEYDPVNVMQVLEKTRELSEAMGDEDQFIINLTSGTKVWSILFHEAFESKPHVQFIYVDQNCNVYDMTTGDTMCGTTIDMNRIFKLNNTSILSCMDFGELSGDDLDAIKAIRALHQANWIDFTMLTVSDTRDKQKMFDKSTGSFSVGDSSISWDRNDGTVSFILSAKERGIIEETLTSPHIFDLVFNAGWFEAEVARHMSLWAHAHEVKIGVEFPYVDGNSKNEIDVIVNTGQRLVFVECKTQIHNLTDLDKFSKAVHNYGGMGCIALFVTFASMTPKALEKCRDNGIVPFSFRDTLLAAREPEKPFAIRKNLHQLLDQCLLTINKK